jgi:SAM-dependent methyltransferase
MLLHAIRRSFGIVCTNPSKLFMVLTPTGWKRFAGLTKERVHKKDPATLARLEAIQQAKRIEFQSDAWKHDEGVSVRQYESYEKYIAHQKDKLDSLDGKAFVNPEKAVNMFRRRFELVSGLPSGSSVLCLGARCGEEVRAFIGLGHFAIGIDLNPGETSRYVVTGDFHMLQFADGSVDCVYVNCLDHALDIQKILTEVRRVLKPQGLFIADIVYGHEEGYAAGNHDTMHWAKARDFGEFMAGIANFKIQEFRDLDTHGSPLWTQCVMRKP